MLDESEILLEDSTKVRYLNLMGEIADYNNAFLEIHAGAGGTESQDWAEMLQRMYIRWAESHEAKVSLLQETRGEEAGIKSCILKIVNDYSLIVIRDDILVLLVFGFFLRWMIK